MTAHFPRSAAPRMHLFLGIQNNPISGGYVVSGCLNIPTGEARTVNINLHSRNTGIA